VVKKRLKKEDETSSTLPKIISPKYVESTLGKRRPAVTPDPGGVIGKKNEVELD
jgi:hypothetical protein